jgi:hypothetical protein
MFHFISLDWIAVTKLENKMVQKEAKPKNMGVV